MSTSAGALSHLPGSAGPSTSRQTSVLTAPASSSQTRPQRRHRPRCAECGSRRFRRNADTGLLVCREGHVLQGYREEEVHDDQDFVTLGQRRDVRKGRRKRRQRERLEVWHGNRARFLGLECLQLLLRLQLKALRIEWPDLPPEIEAIARDLWAMFVSTLHDLEPTPYKENLDFVIEQCRSQRESSQNSDRRNRSRSRSRSRMMEEHERWQEMQETQRLEDERMDEEELRIEAEMSGALDQDEVPSQDGQSKARDSFSSQRQRKRLQSYGIVTLVAIIYLALITARVPVTWADLHSLLSSNRVPFLSALQALPPGMTAKLPRGEIRKLEEHRVPSICALQAAAAHLAGDLNSHFGVQFPELNAPPIVWRCLRHMGMPPTFYQPTLALLAYLGIPLAVVPKQAVSDPWSLLSCAPEQIEELQSQQDGPPERILPPLPSRFGLSSQKVADTRCMIIMEALIVIIKMRYGLDGKDRVEAAGHDVETPRGGPRLDDWLRAIGKAEETRLHHRAFHYELNAHPSDMAEEAIDDLLNMAEETLFERHQPNVRHADRKDDLKQLFGSLPDPVVPRFLPPFEQQQDEAAEQTAEQATRPPRQSLLEIQTQLSDQFNEALYSRASDVDAGKRKTAPSDVDDANVLRPGEAYPIYRQHRALEEVHPQLQRVIEYAARFVAVDAQDLADGVSEMERLLIVRIRNAPKAARAREAAAQRQRRAKGAV
ncbi:unnamed protein product [Jaminaea pallidilutea]